MAEVLAEEAASTAEGVAGSAAAAGWVEEAFAVAEDSPAAERFVEAADFAVARVDSMAAVDFAAALAEEISPAAA